MTRSLRSIGCKRRQPWSPGSKAPWQQHDHRLAIIDAAAETGTWIEINAAPKRLDLDWRWWPLAKEKGVKCVINPDAHRTERLQELWFGVGVARKGWLTKADVMNCLPLQEIESALRAKRESSKS